MLKQRCIIVKGSGGGGLGDRLKSVLLGVAYAQKNQRCICADWADQKMIDSPENVFDLLFSFKHIDKLAQKDIASVVNPDKVYPQSWQHNLHRSLHQLYIDIDPFGWDRAMARNRFSFDLCDNKSFHNDEYQTLVMWEFDQAHDYALRLGMSNSMELYQYYARKNLVFNDEINRSIEQFFEKLRKGYADRSELPVIGVHIRMTDEFCQQKSTLSIKDYSEKIDELLLCLPNAKIFVATDNIDIQKKMEILYPNRVSFKDKWFSKPGDKLHFNDDCPDKLESLKDAVTEMGVLSQCDALIYQYNSSFGECAHIFSNAEKVYPLVPTRSFYSRAIKKIKHLSLLKYFK